MTAPLDLKGRIFGRLTAVEFAYSKKPGGRFWRCKCECGKETFVRASSLSRGCSTSCGCFRKEFFPPPSSLSHGMSKTATYRSWHDMKMRVLYPNNANYFRYGGRGITISKSWLQFENFFADMGEMPQGYSLERKNVNGNYTKSNCCLIPRIEQTKNTRRTIRANGRTLKDICRERGISYDTMIGRIKKQGFTPEEAVSLPHTPQSSIRVDGRPLKDCCLEKGVNYTTVLYRMQKKGMTAEEALAMPFRKRG